MMTNDRLRPVKNEADYKAALSRVEVLMDIESRAEAESDELDILVTLIELYEEDQFPMEAPNPIAAIKFRMEQLGISQSDIVPILGSRAKVSEVLSGKRPLTLKMVRALHEHLGIPAELLIKEGSSLPEKPSIHIEKFPVAELSKRGWIKQIANIKNHAEEVLHGMIECAGGQKALPQALFRQGGARSNAKMDINALQAWCLHVLCEARQQGLEGKYEEGTITQDFLREVAQLSIFEEGPKLAKEKLAQHGIALVVASHLPKTYLDGAAIKTIDGVPVVGMTLRYDRLDNFWFCLLHELAHLGRHFNNGDDAFIDDLQLRERNHAPDDERENEADEWAQEALIPEAEWDLHPVRETPSVANVRALAKKVGVNPAIVAGRVRFERKSYRLLSQIVGTNSVQPFFMEGAKHM